MGASMSAQQRENYIRMVKKIGAWSGVRYLRNRGVSFEDAHEIILGFPPRRGL